MSIQNPAANISVAMNFFRGAAARISARALFLLLLAIGASFMFFPIPTRGQAAATPATAPTAAQADVKLVIGGDTIKNNSEGSLSIVDDSLQFTTNKAKMPKMEVKTASILDISTNEDNRQDITGAAHLATMAIPYGGGRVLSLFSHKVDVLTLEFKDANGGYHGTVFVLPQGSAAPIKRQLVAMGAKASVPLAEPAPANK